MNIALCDDNPIDREIITELLFDYFKDKYISYTISAYSSGINLLHETEDGASFDIVFLDIYMENMLGIDVARKLRAQNFTGKIVFLTLSPDFAVASYDVEAAGYLLKPNSYEKLCMLMDRILLQMEEDTYDIKQGRKIIRVPLHEIIYIESSNTKCIFHCQNGEYVMYKRLDEIEQELNDCRFLRSHKSYLVNMDYITEIDKEFTLATGAMVPIRQRNLKEIRTAYINYLARKTTQENCCTENYAEEVEGSVRSEGVL